MALGDADVLDVVGADALLGGGGAGNLALLLAHEHGLELEHARDGEQHGGVLGHQRGGGEACVPARLVKLEESATDARAGDVLAVRVLQVDLAAAVSVEAADVTAGRTTRADNDALLAMREHAPCGEICRLDKTGEKGSVRRGGRARARGGRESASGRTRRRGPARRAPNAASGWARVGSASLANVRGRRVRAGPMAHDAEGRRGPVSWRVANADQMIDEARRAVDSTADGRKVET